MLRSIFLWLIWLGFILYLLVLAPPLPWDWLEPVRSLLAGRIPAVNPVMLSLFSLMGIWLLIYSCLIFPDGRMQTLPAWAFMVASLGTGVFALIPYLALRRPNQDFAREKDPWIAILDSQLTGIILTISTIILVLFAAIWGDWSGFVHEFVSNKFIHGMTLAIGLFCLLFPYPTLLQDDMARRGLVPNSQLFQLAAWMPLFGPLSYLCLRPPLLAFRYSRSS
jgi:hypothetical protein